MPAFSFSNFLSSSSFSSSKGLISLLRSPFSIQPRRVVAAAAGASFFLSTATTMSLNLSSHAFAGNSIKAKTPKSTDPFGPNLAFDTLKTRILEAANGSPASPNFKVLPFRKGRPLAGTWDGGEDSSGSNWSMGWVNLVECRNLLSSYGMEMSCELFVYLGSRAEEGEVYWAVDVSDKNGAPLGEFGGRKFCFVELRTLMVATDWDDERAMTDLAIAGHARALLEWHSTSKFCGNCGGQMIPMEAGRRKQCINQSCKKRVYPRIDPVVIMLVIDRENDSVLLSRQSRFVPRMWSCLAGFIEPGESLEEAVRRETWEETGVEVGEVVYHSSQPWPVGPSSMPCQLMVGFLAYAKSREINVDKEELEDAQWHSRESVKKALANAEYKKAQRTAATRVSQMCRGVEKGLSLAADFNVESGELAPMFFPGPFAIAHHLISSWANQDLVVNGVQTQLRFPSSSLSSL
ncbi:hypothetical protein SAY87_018167 [Trapa incisa]|uniref:NAD(+) diphosphatase n=1 Tax=Trapa incisa TaxID=236973 RepID=A0AAN7QVZ5_9MYRT|nr:hypothetical protein SAY87_018167 [Trapa incisa]